MNGMSKGRGSFEYLLEKLQSFVKAKNYQSLLSGLLSLVIVVIPIAILFIVLEYNLYLSKGVRAFFFWTLLLVSFVGLSYLVLYPLWKWIDSTGEKTREEAAKLIGNHFPEVKDKLLNILYLNNMYSSTKSMELVDASIGQKSMELKGVNFQEAINFDGVKRMAKILGFIALLITIMTVISPRVVSDSVYRIVNYDTEFSPQAPFDFIVNNKTMKVSQYSDVIIRAKLKGENLPNQMYIEFDGVQKLMSKNKNGYSFKIADIQKTTDYRLYADGFYSKNFKVDVVPFPSVQKMKLIVYPPSYTGLKSTVQSSGDINTQFGSNVNWRIKGKHVGKMKILFGEKEYEMKVQGEEFSFSKNLTQNGNYTLKLYSATSNSVDSHIYHINLMPDAYPSILVKEFDDKVENIKYYAGDVSDDFGIKKLQFVVRYLGKINRFIIPINSQTKNQSFQYSTTDILNRYPRGANLEYYFEVWDNDAVNGSKSSKSRKFSISRMTENQLKDQLNNNSDDIQNDIKNAVNDAKQIQSKLDDIKKKLLQKSKLDINDKKQVEELLKLQKELESKLESTQDQMKRNFDKKNELSDQKEQLQNEKEQLDDFSDRVKNPEIQKLMEKIQKLMENDKQENLMKDIDEFNEKSDKMEQSLEHLQKLYEQLDYKQKLNDMIDKLKELAKKQKDLAKQNNSDKEKQKELNKKTKDAEQDLNDLMKKNKKLNKSKDKEFKEVKEKLQDAIDKQDKSMDGKDNMGQQQQDAGEKLEEAADRLQKLKEEQESDQNAEDYRTLRRVLENIIYLSFEQEKLLEETKSTPYNSTEFSTLTRKQKKLYDDFVTVEDSLYKVAYRQPKVKKVIFEEIDKIKNNSEKAISYLKDRNSNKALVNEQYTMASYNKLGLMISESLKNLQMNSKNKKSGNKQCNNPKPGGKGKKSKGKMSMKKLSEMQKQLNNQMEKLMKNMKQGKNGKLQKGKMSKELAKMAAQQQAISDAIKKIEEQKNSADKTGKKPMGNQLKEIMEKLNKTEQELYNKKITSEMIKRQREIEVKMLESSKAEQQQDEEMKRKSQKAKSYTPEKPADFLQYIQNKKQNKSVIEKNMIKLRPYYQSLSDKYFQLIK